MLDLADVAGNFDVQHAHLLGGGVAPRFGVARRLGSGATQKLASARSRVSAI
jgi:hypothetical protein